MATLSRQITPSLTEIYVDGEGNYITQAQPTNFHQFFTRKVLTGSETIDDFREVTEAQRTQLECSDAEAQAYAKIPYTLDKRIRRGVIPFKARRGIIYYDMGAVKVTWNHWAPIGNSEIVSDTERVFDLSRFADLIGDNARVFVRAVGGVDRAKENWCMSHLSYNASTHLLTLNGGKTDWKGVGIIVSCLDNSGHGSACARNTRNNVVYFDRYMKLQRVRASKLGAYEFAHTLSSETAAAFVTPLLPADGIVSSALFMSLGINIKIWRYKRHDRIYNKDTDAERKYSYSRFTLWKPKGLVAGTFYPDRYDTRKTRLFRVQIKSRKGYTSRMVRVSRRFVFHNRVVLATDAVAID